MVVAPALMSASRGTHALIEAEEHDGRWYAPLTCSSKFAAWLGKGAHAPCVLKWLMPLQRVVQDAMTVAFPLEDAGDDLMDGLGLEGDKASINEVWRSLRESGREPVATVHHPSMGDFDVWFRPRQPNAVWIHISEDVVSALEAYVDSITPSGPPPLADASSPSPSTPGSPSPSSLVLSDGSTTEVESPSMIPFAQAVSCSGKVVQWRSQRKTWMVRVKDASGQWITKAFKPKTDSIEDKSAAEALAWDWAKTLC